MPTRERIVLVVAAGLALATVASVLSLIVWEEVVEPPDGGWFAYAPSTAVTFAASDSSDTSEAALYVGGIWLGTIAIWASVALRLLRAPFDGSRRIGRQPEGA
jgi:hypothetical protein